VLIALLAILGVNLIVIVVLLASVLARKRWVKRQHGSFRGVIRVSNGEIDGLRPKWGRGYGRWVRDVLVWTKAPFFFRNELVPADGLEHQRPAGPAEVKRLGEHPVIAQLRADSATVEVAAHDEEIEQLLGPFRESVAVRRDPSAPPEHSSQAPPMGAHTNTDR
jgi:Protein of unknown function (DUF2550)